MKNFKDGYISARETVARKDLTTCDGRQNQDKGDEEPLRSNDQGETRGGERESHQSVVDSGRILYGGLYCGGPLDWEQRMIIMMMVMMKLS